MGSTRHVIQTIYNGLSLADWSAESKPVRTSCQVLVSTVGNIRRVKGHDIFIKAAASLVQRWFPGAKFGIAGEVLDSVYFAELQDMVRNLGLTDRFQFCGGVTNLQKHLSTSDVFVLPSRSEGFSNAIVEAMAASLPARCYQCRRKC